MSGKLDQSLDEILKTRPRGDRRGRSARRGPGRPAAAAAPVGGVTKTTRQPKQSKAAATAPAPAVSGESKIMISNLPLDIEESQLRDYFVSAIGVGKPKKTVFAYGPTGRSLGTATVTFFKSDQALKALKALDNVKIDNRPVKVEILVSAANAPAPVPKAPLADRVSQPKKDKPKPATVSKATPASTRGRGRGRGGTRGGRDGRGKKKTVEELDAEMEDYFPAVEGGNDANGTATTGDTAMDDEML